MLYPPDLFLFLFLVMPALIVFVFSTMGLIANIYFPKWMKGE